MIEDKDNKLYEAYTKNVLHNKDKPWQLVKKLRTKKSFLEQLNKGNPLYTQYLNQNKDDSYYDSESSPNWDNDNIFARSEDEKTV